MITNDLEVSEIGGTPIAGWFIRLNPIEMDDLEVAIISGNLDILNRCFSGKLRIDFSYID